MINHDVPRKPPAIPRVRPGIRTGSRELLTVGKCHLDYRLTGESSTDPTEFMFVLKRKSSPIFRMISVDDKQVGRPFNSVRKAERGRIGARTFVRHTNLACFADYFRDVFRLFNRR